MGREGLTPPDRCIVQSVYWRHEFQKGPPWNVDAIAGLDKDFPVGSGKGVRLTEGVLAIGYLEPPPLASYELEGDKYGFLLGVGA